MSLERVREPPQAVSIVRARRVIQRNYVIFDVAKQEGLAYLEAQRKIGETGTLDEALPSAFTLWLGLKKKSVSADLASGELPNRRPSITPLRGVGGGSCPRALLLALGGGGRDDVARAGFATC